MEASRPAEPDDVPRVAELARALRAELRTMRGGAVWAEREALAEPLDDAYAALLDRDDACVVVGTIDDVVVGFAAVVVDVLHDGARLGIVTDLFVEEGARSIGVVSDRLQLLGVDRRAATRHLQGFPNRNHVTPRSYRRTRRALSACARPSLRQQTSTQPRLSTLHS